jgi:hypothetical protein
MNPSRFVIGAVLLGVAGLVAVCGFGSKDEKPVVKSTAVSVGPPPDGSLGKTNCPCPGGKCSVCLCKEPGECNPPKAQPKAVVCICGGDGLLDGPYGPLLCPTCGKGKSSDLPSFNPTLYTQPQPKAVEYVQVQEPYTYSYGVLGRRRGTGYRTVTMTKDAYEARQKATKPKQTYYYGGGCANGRCGR